MFLFCCTLLFQHFFVGKATAAPVELNFGIISTEASQNLRAVWQPLLDDMAKQTGLKVNAFFASDYAGIITAMEYNKVQLAWYGNESALQAVNRANGQIFAQVINADGSGGYYSHIIVPANSSLTDIQGMLKNAATLNFANGDPNSTSGFLIPGYYVFAKNNVDPKAIFKRVITGSHETNALSVATGQVDAATCNSEVMRALKTTHPDQLAKIKIIWTSPLIPGDPLVWRADLPQNVKDKVSKFFLNYGQNEHEKEVLANLGYKGFKASSNEQLLPIQQIALYKEKTGIEASTSLSAEEKKKQVAALDAQIAEISAKLDAKAKAGQ